MPTLGALCGIAIPDGFEPDGISLKTLLMNSGQPWKRDHHVEQFLGGAFASAMPPKAREFSVVMSERWRLVNSQEEQLFDIKNDPGQRKNVAKQHPEVVTRLRGLYEPFWKTVSPRLGPVRTYIGDAAQNPVVLCSQDWRLEHGNPPWNFGSIRKLPKKTGPWMLEIRKAGLYRITLRQFPKEADRVVMGVKAQIDIAEKTLMQAINPGSKGVVFEVDLSVGCTELITRIFDEKEKAGGAYFSEVELMRENKR